MKTIVSTVTKISVSEIEGLDPITVILEDIAVGKGKIIIECFGKSWASSWNAMSGKSIAEFFCSCDEHYLSGNLSNVRSSIDDVESMIADLRKQVIQLRRKNEIDSDDARELFDAVVDMSEMDLINYDNNCIAKILGDEWRHDYYIPQKGNPEYEYLCRIIKTVQQALKDSGLYRSA